MGAVGRYELLERIGIGGMAEIYRARAIGRDAASEIVCVKKILPHLSEDPEYRQMFMDEARVAFTLHHPNVVQVRDLGRIDDQLFLALEYVDGVDLGELLLKARDRDMLLPVPVALYIALEVLKGLHYAHSRRAPDGRAMAIVHRDVSPGNVLVSRTGAVKLGDFGIARAAVRAGRTIAGVVKGNALYMAPEQITGQTMDARTDVYGAGLLLLTLLCGRHPYEREPLPKLIDFAVGAEVPDPSSLVASLPRELDVIVSRATEPDPGVRYQTAREFGAAIENFAESRGLILDTGTLVAFLAPLLPPPRVDPPASAEPPKLVTYVGPLEEVTAVSAGGVSESVFRTLVGPVEPVPDRTMLSPSPDDEPPLVRGREIPPKRPSRLKPAVPVPVALSVPPPEGPASTVVGGHRQSIAAIAFPSAKVALSTGLDQTVRVWDLDSMTERRSWRAHDAAVICLALSRDGTTALTGSRDRTLRLWDVATGAQRRSFSGHDGWVFSCALSDDGRRAVSGSQDRTLRVWDGDRPEATAVISGHRDTVVALALFPDGRSALSGSYDRSVRLWDLERRAQVRLFDAGESVRAVALAPDAISALSGGADCCVSQWNLEDGSRMHQLRGHRESVVAVAFSPDGHRALSGSYDGTAILWDLGEARAVCSLVGHTDPVTAVAFSPDGRRALTGSADGTLRLWSLP